MTNGEYPPILVVLEYCGSELVVVSVSLGVEMVRVLPASVREEAFALEACYL